LFYFEFNNITRKAKWSGFRKDIENFDGAEEKISPSPPFILWLKQNQEPHQQQSMS